jgi:hypothetical protein
VAVLKGIPHLSTSLNGVVDSWFEGEMIQLDTCHQATLQGSWYWDSRRRHEATARTSPQTAADEAEEAIGAWAGQRASQPALLWLSKDAQDADLFTERGCCSFQCIDLANQRRADVA